MIPGASARMRLEGRVVTCVGRDIDALGVWKCDASNRNPLREIRQWKSDWTLCHPWRKSDQTLCRPWRKSDRTLCNPWRKSGRTGE